MRNIEFLKIAKKVSILQMAAMFVILSMMSCSKGIEKIKQQERPAQIQTTIIR